MTNARSTLPSNRFPLTSFLRQIAALLLFVGLTLCLATSSRASDGGTLINPRFDHTATRLADGRVLVVGGLIRSGNAYNVTAACELYDPSTNTWSSTGSLNISRYQHGAVLLADGRVLALGGEATNLAPTNSAETYDPATGRWTPTGSMSVPRASIDPVLLPDGKVLVAGSGGDFKSCELYDRATGGWSITGSLLQRRNASQLTVLKNGNVLIAGGHSQRVGYLSETELYNPAIGTWKKQGSLAQGRIYHGQALLSDGRVLVAGGLANPPSTVRATRSTEIYDPTTRLWTTAHPLGMERFYFTVNLLSSGQILAAGGNDEPGPYALDSLEQFDPTIEAWHTLPETLATPRSSHTATTLLDGRVIIAGGFDTAGFLIPQCEIVDTAP